MLNQKKREDYLKSLRFHQQQEQHLHKAKPNGDISSNSKFSKIARQQGDENRVNSKSDNRFVFMYKIFIYNISMMKHLELPHEAN